MTRQELVEVNYATLDGEPAAICGSKNRFATVRVLKGGSKSAEFAWETVERIVTLKDAQFKS